MRAHFLTRVVSLDPSCRSRSMYEPVAFRYRFVVVANSARRTELEVHSSLAFEPVNVNVNVADFQRPIFKKISSLRPHQPSKATARKTRPTRPLYTLASSGKVRALAPDPDLTAATRKPFRSQIQIELPGFLTRCSCARLLPPSRDVHHRSKPAFSCLVLGRHLTCSTWKKESCVVTMI